jgi:hypothetical protein
MSIGVDRIPLTFFSTSVAKNPIFSYAATEFGAEMTVILFKSIRFSELILIALL